MRRPKYKYSISSIRKWIEAENKRYEETSPSVPRYWYLFSYIDDLSRRIASDVTGFEEDLAREVLRIHEKKVGAKLAKTLGLEWECAVARAQEWNAVHTSISLSFKSYSHVGQLLDARHRFHSAVFSDAKWRAEFFSQLDQLIELAEQYAEMLK